MRVWSVELHNRVQKKQKVTSLWVRVTKRDFSSRPEGWKIDTHLLLVGSYALIFILSLYFSLFFLLRTQGWGHGTGNGWEWAWVDEWGESARGEEGAGDSFWTLSLHKSAGERQKENMRKRARKRKDPSAEIFFRWFKVQSHRPLPSSQISPMIKQLCIYLPVCFAPSGGWLQ